MQNLKQHEDDIIDVVVTGQAFSDAIDTISEKYFYKYLLKKRGNDFMGEMKKITDDLLSNTIDEQHRREIMMIFDVNILLNAKLNKLDLLQKKALADNFDRVYDIIDELVNKLQQ